MSARSRFLFVATTLVALCLICALSGSTLAAPGPDPVQPEQMQSTPEPEEPPADEPEEAGQDEELDEPIEGEEVGEEVVPPPLEPAAQAPPTPPAPAPGATVVPPPVTTPVVPTVAETPIEAPPPVTMQTPPPVAIETTKTPVSEAPTELPADLRKICARLAASPFASDPVAAEYMARVNSGHPTPDDMNDFGVLLGRKYYLKDAEAFIKAATAQDKTNTDYWLNLGTVRLQRNKLSSALVAYEKALDLDPNRGLTHYNIGVVHDYMRNYDEAVDSFARALALDPSLGDPKVNPLAVNNDRLLVVNLLLYQAKDGGLAMPLRGGPPLPPPPKQSASESKKSRS